MKIRFSLYTKMLLGYLLFGALCLLFVNFFSARMINSLMVQYKAKELYRNASSLAGFYQEHMYHLNTDSDKASASVSDTGNGSFSDSSGEADSGEVPDPDSPEGIAMQTVLERFHIFAEASSAHIWFVDRNGMITLDSEWKTLQEPVASEFRAADFPNSFYICGNYLPGEFSRENEESITTYTSLTRQYAVTGYIVITLPCSELNAQCYYMQTIVYITVVAVIGLSLVLLVIFTFSFYLPLRRITKAADEYAAGNFVVRPQVNSHDEMGYLAATLGYMASEIEESGEGQRKLVANISHDFRSPLTSIKGYLEAMLDGTIPPELQPKYMRIVLDETERLNKLAQNLLVLNTIQTKENHLNYSVFDINHMIRKISASFEGTCQKRGIRFELLFSDVSLEVYADRDKIQQVLYNLVDNAIKFSEDRGIIEIETSTSHDKAFISVKDHGVGIPKEEMGKIWNRFYKSDSSRGKDKKGTGLGLAIAKDIIQSHHESIDVVSTAGVGTKFTFRLPLPKAQGNESSE